MSEGWIGWKKSATNSINCDPGTREGSPLSTAPPRHYKKTSPLAVANGLSHRATRIAISLVHISSEEILVNARGRVGVGHIERRRPAGKGISGVVANEESAEAIIEWIGRSRRKIDISGESSTATVRERGECFVVNVIRIVTPVHPTHSHQSLPAYGEPGKELVMSIRCRRNRFARPGGSAIT